MKAIALLKKYYTDYIGSKLFNQVIAICLLIFILLAVILSVGYYATVKQSINDSYVENTESMLRIAANNFSSYINQISEVSLSLRSNEDLIYKIMDDAHLFEIKNELRLADYLRYEELGIVKMEYYCPKTSANYEIVGEGISQKTASFTDQGWYAKLLLSEKYSYIENRYNTDNPYYEADSYAMIFRRNILDIPLKQPAVIVSIYIDKSTIEHKMDFLRNDANDIVLLFDGNDQLYYVSSGVGEQLIHSSTLGELKDKEQIEIEDVRYQVASNTSDRGEWYLVKLVKEDLLINNLNRMFSVGLSVIVCFLTLLFLVFLFLIRKIRQNIANLITQINKVGKGDFSNQIAVTGDDELGRLTDEFNRMTRRIKRLIDKNYKLKIKEKDAMLKVLESQINPHFLYNTLQAISGLAIENGQTKIADMLKELATSFRYKISAQTSTTVYDEIEHMRTYIKLCKLRFGDRIDAEYDVDIEALDVIIPKMLFQHLVENTIKHAMEKTMSDVRIELSVAKRENVVDIYYRDNGIGMRQDELERLRERIERAGSEEDEQDRVEQPDGIGLVNTYQRLTLGDLNLISFDIESEYMKYFSVRIKWKENTGDV